MHHLLEEIRGCTECKNHLLEGPRPVVAAHPESRVVIVGQAPGRKVHQSGVPWDDPSGDQLRKWLNISKEDFYNPEKIALIPMGFCYPGKGKSGDLPPRPECAPLWHNRLFAMMEKVRLTLLVGQYAQKYYLKGKRGRNLTETVRQFKDYLPKYFPTPHPSPRNRFWLSKNPWFEKKTLPVLKEKVQQALRP